MYGNNVSSLYKSVIFYHLTLYLVEPSRYFNYTLNI